MEEHTNYPFRLLMKQHGASLVCTERIDAADVARRDRRALRLLHTTSQETPRAGQISGADPAVMAEAARVVEEQGFDHRRSEFRVPHPPAARPRRGRRAAGRPAGIAAIVAAVVRAVSRSGDIEDPQRSRRRARDGGGSGAAGRGRRGGGGGRSRPQRGPGLRRRSGLGRGGAGQAGGADPGAGQRRRPRAGRRPALPARDRGRRRGDRPRLPGQPVDLPPVPGAVRGRSRRRGRRRRASAAGSCLQLVEGEFRLYGPAVGLRRLARTSCYFAKFVPDFAAFREAVHRVRDLAGFRRLVKEHFG